MPATSIPVALSTGSVYTYGTNRAFELAARAGFDGVEVIVDDRWDTRQADYLNRLSAETGVPVLSIHSPFFMLRLPGWPRQEVERIKLALALTEAVGARTLNLHVPLRVRDLSVGLGPRIWRLPVPGPIADQVAFRAWLTGGGLAELQAQTRVVITVENLPMRRVFGRKVDIHALNTWAEIERFPNVCLDTTHTGTTGADLLAVYARLAHRIRHVHLSDYDGRYQHRPIGAGYLPLGPFLDAVATRPYDGVLVLELDPGGLPVHDPAKVEVELRRCLAFCRERLGQRVETGTTAQTAQTAAAQPVPVA